MLYPACSVILYERVALYSLYPEKSQKVAHKKGGPHDSTHREIGNDSR